MKGNYRIIRELSLCAPCDPSTRFESEAEHDRPKTRKPLEGNTGASTKQDEK